MVASVSRHLKSGEDQQAYDIASLDPSPMGRILTQAMEVKDQDRETLEAVLVHATETETRELSRYLQALATIGNITPLLGLLGTVLGHDQGLYGHPADGGDLSLDLVLVFELT